MRSRVALSLLLGAAALAGCPAPALPPDVPATRDPLKPSPPEDPVPAYLIADPDALLRGRAVLLTGNSFGAIVDGQRMIVPIAGLSDGGPAVPEKGRIAREITAPPITAVDRVPPWLGGGFLFRAGSALYASEVFDGALRPVVTLSSTVIRVSFGPRGALVRASDGQRWMIDLATGTRGAIAPPGLLDIAALADGRAAAITEGGRLFVSQDRGDHWTDLTAQLGGAPTDIVTQQAQPAGDKPRTSAPQPDVPSSMELWISDDLPHAYRLEPNGALREFDQLPAAPSAIRPRDPAWHGGDAPLLAAVRRGVRIDDGAALVAENGDIARVDLRTGRFQVIGPGRVPPDMPCEGLRAGDDVVFICATPHRASAVISRAIGDEGGWVERTFPEGGPFYVGDDGVIIFGGSCDGQRMMTSACVRDLHGEWQNVDALTVSDAGVDAEAGADAAAGDDAFDPADILRWVPRPGGRPLVILGGTSPGTFDPATGASTLWPTPEGKSRVDDEVIRAFKAAPSRDRACADRGFTATDAGEVRGWLADGTAIRISPQGEVTRSAYHFDHANVNGPFAFAFDKERRAWQSTDRGETWAEVEGPPREAASNPQQCSIVGCDLGAWARIGWAARPPVHALPPPAAPAPPSLPRIPLREITCTPAGDERVSALPLTDGLGEGSGLGARAVPKSGVDKKTDGAISYQRRFFSRGMINPAYGRSADEERALRLLSHGYGAEFVAPDDAHGPFDGISVLGPSRDGQSYRRNLTFVEVFDPSAAVRSTSFGLRDLIDVSRVAGMPLGRLFASEGPDIDAVVPILPVDPAGPGGYVFTFNSEPGQVVATVTGGASPRVKIAGLRGTTDALPAISAAEVAPGDIAILSAGSDGADDLYRLSAAGITGVMQLAAPSSAEWAPANPDAVAVGPQGAIAILRTPSGAEPPSANDPAVIFPAAGGPPQPLAPWSTLTAADDPACRADSAGYRAMVVTVSPWIRVKGAPSLAATTAGVMAARVRWSPARVCLEALEMPSVTRPIRGGDSIETTIIARFLGPGGAARVGMIPGAELRQPLSCALSPP